MKRRVKNNKPVPPLEDVYYYLAEAAGVVRWHPIWRASEQASPGRRNTAQRLSDYALGLARQGEDLRNEIPSERFDWPFPHAVGNLCEKMADVFEHPDADAHVVNFLIDCRDEVVEWVLRDTNLRLAVELRAVSAFVGK